jgi:hypothetical protein
MERLPTPREMRQRLRIAKHTEKQNSFERRQRCREIMFGNGNGLMQNLSPEDRKFCHSVWKECYEVYLATFRGGAPRFQCGKGWKQYSNQRRFVNTSPVGPRLHFEQWWRAQKGRWINFDVPRMLKQKQKESESGGDTRLPQLHQEARL